MPGVMPGDFERNMQTYSCTCAYPPSATAISGPGTCCASIGIWTALFMATSPEGAAATKATVNRPMHTRATKNCFTHTSTDFRDGSARKPHFAAGTAQHCGLTPNSASLARCQNRSSEILHIVGMSVRPRPAFGRMYSSQIDHGAQINDKCIRDRRFAAWIDYIL